MLRACLAVLVLTVSAYPLLSKTASASSAGPPPARTGGFGEMTCHECHWDNPINDSAGSVKLIGIPPMYTPGEAYTITVSVTHPDSRRAGFELSARVEERSNAGGSAGQLRSTDQLTRVVEEKGIAYISQTDTGSKALTSDTGRWTFEWTAPRSGDPVIFHAAANAANGDASPLGDYVYTSEARTRAR